MVLREKPFTASQVRGPRTLEFAQRMSQKLAHLDYEFRSHHHALIDLIDDEESLAESRTCWMRMMTLSPNLPHMSSK